MPRYLCREGNTFLFRRRVPRHLHTRLGQREIYRSLKTSVARLAKQRAAALYLASEKLFAMAEDYTVNDEDIRAAARHWLEQPHWQTIFDRQIDSRLPGDLRWEGPNLPDKLLELGTDREQGITRLWARRHEAEAALEVAGYPPQSTSILDRTAEVLVGLIHQRVEKRMQEVFRPEDSRITVAAGPQSKSPVPDSAVAPDASPKISKNVEVWVAYLQDPKEEDEKAIPYLHAKQKGVCVRILSELLGDRPLGSVTREDAKEFRRQLLRLPVSHGKGRWVHAREAIAKADGSGKDKYTLKTVKRYFSALNGYWKWHRNRKLVPDVPSPFSGHTFPGTKSSKSNRDDWSVSDLERLFKSNDYRSYPRDSADHWLPLIALHSGMRLEEIARLRVNHDVVLEGKIACFKIQVHPDGWDPKSEAGEREIPIHSWLIRHGLIKLVEQRRREGAERLFPDLSNGGVTGTYGAEFSKRFSNLKISLGVGKKTVFHSFRHTFRTEVDGVDVEERFIDAVMGHEGKRGEGATYRKRVPLSRRQEVVEGFRSPIPLDFLNDADAAGRRPARVRKVRLTPPDLA